MTVNSMRVLIYGFGRMGLTHYAILNSLLPDASFTFVDPNKVLNFISKKNIKGKFVKSDKNLKGPFDLTLITTPPFIHKELLNNSLSRGDKRVFVEKPFGGHSNFDFDAGVKNVFIGYVLRFNPIVSWVKENINPEDIKEVKSQYLSNTIENKPKGWRNGTYSGVLNEMGSHILDLNNYLFNIKDYKILSKEIQSHISDVDDKVRFSIDSKERIFDFYFNWVDKSIRKPIFSVEVFLKNGEVIKFDQQKVQIEKDGKIENISVVQLEERIPYYLRGVDFTKQMEDLLEDQHTLCSITEALVTNNLMKEILK
jgi:predicted dehydrogenase